jgi:2-oxo-4-hydroxy-4-carboxy-5-ureidoimidazoline decarboxylase
VTTGAAAAEPHARLNALSPEEAQQALRRCCGSSRWVAAMVDRRPFSSTAALHDAADRVWRTLERADFLEAFAHHPPIGSGSGSGGGAPRETADGVARAWSAEEQARVAEAGADVATALRALNQAYAVRFGYIFIVCATGKSAEQMLALLRARIENDPETELGVAAAEQAKITRLRLEKLAR